jgi:ribosome modulation factor
MVFNWQKRAYEKGFEAYIQGKTVKECPHSNKDCLLRAAWMEGYTYASETNHQSIGSQR